MFFLLTTLTITWISLFIIAVLSDSSATSLLFLQSYFPVQLQQCVNVVDDNVTGEAIKQCDDLYLGYVTVLWKNINWSGKYNADNNPEIPIQADYFEKLYETVDLKETNEMERLHTNTYIPITDDPITTGEVNCMLKNEKRGL